MMGKTIKAPALTLQDFFCTGLSIVCCNVVSKINLFSGFSVKTKQNKLYWIIDFEKTHPMTYFYVLQNA